jgi:hypothetical protein
VILLEIILCNSFFTRYANYLFAHPVATFVQWLASTVVLDAAAAAASSFRRHRQLVARATAVAAAAAAPTQWEGEKATNRKKI